ncbi:MAG: hypothetical protein ACE5EO_00355 [Candidatus Krumholzibacteriia bacterium]
MVVLTILSVIVSTAVGFKWLSPFLHVAAVFPSFGAAMRARRHRLALALAVRWAVAVFATTVVVGVFVPDQVGRSVVFAYASVTGISQWLNTPGAPPPADYAYLLWGIAVFLAGALLSGGAVAFVVASVALGNAAFGVLFLLKYAFNIVQIALVAIPPWQASILGAALLMLVPASLPFYERVVRTGPETSDRRVVRGLMYAGAVLVVASLLLRVAVAGPWHTVLREWTLF